MPSNTRTREGSKKTSQQARNVAIPHAKQHVADSKSEILGLQHAAGNRAVSEMLKSSVGSEKAPEASAGKPLDDNVRGLMESRFGQDFSGVRVHIDNKANQSAKELGASAYTKGKDIVFATGEYAPGTREGQQRIAHELTHVVQQSRSGKAPSREGQLSSPHDSSEREADAVSRTVAGGGHAPAIVAQGVGIQRTNGKIPLLDDFEKKFADAAKLIRKQPSAMTLVNEAAATGAQFGGYVEDGPANVAAGARAATVGSKVYVPRARTDSVLAMRDFLFELNNAVRKPKFDVLDKEATKGSKGTLDAKKYAYKTVELEVEGMLRLGKIWFEIKKTMPKGAKTEAYGPQFYASDYESVKSGKKSKDDLTKEVLKRVYDSGDLKGKTVEQKYMDDYKSLSGGK